MENEIKNNKTDFWKFVEKRFNDTKNLTPRQKEGYEMLQKSDQQNEKEMKYDKPADASLQEYGQAV
jgi:hypothetical protein